MGLALSLSLGSSVAGAFTPLSQSLPTHTPPPPARPPCVPVSSSQPPQSLVPTEQLTSPIPSRPSPMFKPISSSSPISQAARQKELRLTMSTTEGGSPLSEGKTVVLENTGHSFAAHVSEDKTCAQCSSTQPWPHPPQPPLSQNSPCQTLISGLNPLDCQCVPPQYSAITSPQPQRSLWVAASTTSNTGSIWYLPRAGVKEC